jgi:prepilin-type processing-associated H-X9-DG protein
LNYPLQEDLLGYVLGALDATEERDIQQKIENDPELKDHVQSIRQRLLPLEALDTPTGMRPGMARRTCEWVAGVDKDPGLAEPHQIQSMTPIDDFDYVDALCCAPSIDPTKIDHAHDLAGAKAASKVPATNGTDSDVAPDSAATIPQTPALSPSPANTVAADTATTGVELASRSSANDPKFQLLHPRTWSMTDALSGVAILAVIGSILFPAISYQRYNSRLLSCENNLHQIGNALLEYSDINGGNFVEIPTQGPLSASGYFAPALVDAGLVQDDRVFSCAGLGQSNPIHIPSIAQIESASIAQLQHLRRTMSGNYGYSMGYQSGDRYRPLSNRGLTNTVLVADMPSLKQPSRNSINHGRWGQNCLFGDGHVKFIRGDSIGQDAIFVNDYGIVAPGTSELDSVIAPSHLSPAKW